MLGVATAGAEYDRNGVSRARERRTLLKWLAEYEERVPIDCPFDDYELQGRNELLESVRCLC
jgi:hypothetical protein